MPIGASKVGALGGLVPGGSVTFNASGTWDVPPGVKVVSITGKGGTGNPGVAGNPGNPGNPGSGGGGGSGGRSMIGTNPTAPPTLVRNLNNLGGNAFKFGLNQFTGPIYTLPIPQGGNGPPAWYAPFNNRCPAVNSPAVTFSGIGPGQPGTTPYSASDPKNQGQTGQTGQAGSAGTGGTAGNCGQPSSALGNTFPGGAGGNAPPGGAAGNGGSGGQGGTSAHDNSAGSGGNGGGNGGASFFGPGNQLNPLVYAANPGNLSDCIFYLPGLGGGGAGAVNSGQNGVPYALMIKRGSSPGYPPAIPGLPPSPGNQLCFTAIGGTGNPSVTMPVTPGPSTTPVLPTSTFGGNGYFGPQGLGAAITMGGLGNSQNNRNTISQVNPVPLRPEIFRAGGGGGGGSSGNLQAGQSFNGNVQYITSGGGGGGGRGNAGNAGGNSPTVSGFAGVPQTFNCVPVTPGTPTPITVGTPGGQIVISWNPQ